MVVERRLVGRTPGPRACSKDFADELNAGTTSGFGTLTHVARLSEFIHPDIVVELGPGSPPIQGRETLLGMVSRLQPRTSAFVLEMDDVNVEFTDPDHGDVTFTALIRRRSSSRAKNRSTRASSAPRSCAAAAAGA